MSIQKPEFTPKISIGDVVGMCVAIVAAAGFAWDVRSDVKVQAQRVDDIKIDQVEVKAEMTRSEARIETNLRDIKATMIRIEDKLDRKADK